EKAKSHPPDLTKLEQVFDDDFADPAKSVLLSPGKPVPTREAPWVLEQKGGAGFFNDHRLVTRIRASDLGPGFVAGNFAPTPRLDAGFACLVRGAFFGQGDGGWALLLAEKGKGRYGLAVCVSRAGEVEITEWDALDADPLSNHPKHGKFAVLRAS